MANMKVTMCGIEFNNPITVASGTFGSGMEYDSLEDLNREKRKTKAGYIFGIVMFVITMLISFLVRILR